MLDGIFADRELLRDVLVGVTSSDCRDDLQLASGELEPGRWRFAGASALVPKMPHEIRYALAIEPILPGHDRPDRLAELRGGRLLQDDTTSTKFERQHDISAFDRDGQQDGSAGC